MSVDPGRQGWAAWTVVVPTIIGGLLAAAFGSFGWFLNSFGIRSDCTDKYDCATDDCSPCSTMIQWIMAGGVGQWILTGAAVALFVLGMRRQDWRHAVALAGFAIVPLSVAWWIISTVVAEHSY